MYRNDIDNCLVIMYYNMTRIGFSFKDDEHSITTSYVIENYDFDFIKKIYKIVPWEDEYKKEIIKSFFTYYKEYISLL